MRARPDFIIIGAMKCGTSTLYSQLVRHPGIFMTTPKEPNFFSDDDVYRRGMGWYRGLFESAGPEDLLGEASTHYTKLPVLPNTVARMSQALPDVKLIYLMRHPVERLISHYLHESSRRAIEVPLEVAIREVPELVDFGLYAMQLRPYLDVYRSERILPVFLERLGTCPQSELDRICKFIGYRARGAWDPAAARKNASAERVRAGRLAEWLLHQPQLRELRRGLVPARVRRRLADRWRMDTRPDLVPSARATLEELFDADLRVLGGWLGVELNCRNFEAAVKARPLEWNAVGP